MSFVSYNNDWFEKICWLFYISGKDVMGVINDFLIRFKFICIKIN